jgi:hypothetical protein
MSPVNPEQSFVAWNACVPRSACFVEDSADAEKASTTSKPAPARRPRKRFGNPIRLAMEASSTSEMNVRAMIALSGAKSHRASIPI